MIEQSEGTEQDNLRLEQNELDALLDKGIELEIGKEKYIIYRPFGGQLDLLAECLLKMEHDTDAFDENSDLEAQKLVKKSMRWMARAIAIMVLGQKCAKLHKNPFTKSVSAKIDEKRIVKMTDYILWNMSMKDVVTFSQKLTQLTGIVDFILSIRYTLRMTKRTTKPNLIEQNKPA